MVVSWRRSWRGERRFWARRASRPWSSSGHGAAVGGHGEAAGHGEPADDSSHVDFSIEPSGAILWVFSRLRLELAAVATRTVAGMEEVAAMVVVTETVAGMEKRLRMVAGTRFSAGSKKIIERTLGAWQLFWSVISPISRRSSEGAGESPDGACGRLAGCGRTLSRKNGPAWRGFSSIGESSGCCGERKLLAVCHLEKKQKKCSTALVIAQKIAMILPPR